MHEIRGWALNMRLTEKRLSTEQHLGPNVLASAWKNGLGTYGIRVGLANRDAFFDRAWWEIRVEIDGEVYLIPLTTGFWNHCPEFRAPIIRDWLQRHRLLNWPNGRPPKVTLLPLGNGRFRLLASA